jgi:carbohydrate-selective porin OprB
VSVGADVGLAVVVGWTLGAAVAVVTRASGLALGATAGVGAARPQAASSTQTAITIASLFIVALFYHNERQDAKMKRYGGRRECVIVRCLTNTPIHLTI